MKITVDGWLNHSGEPVVAFRMNGLASPVSCTFTKAEAQALCVAIDSELERLESVGQEDADPSPNCRCETCPMGGPYTCVSKD